MYSISYSFFAVKALKQIGRKLGKKDWNFGVDPCSQKGNWELSSDDKKGFESNVTCDCSSATCHVVTMYSSLLFSPSL